MDNTSIFISDGKYEIFYNPATLEISSVVRKGSPWLEREEIGLFTAVLFQELATALGEILALRENPPYVVKQQSLPREEEGKFDRVFTGETRTFDPFLDFDFLGPKPYILMIRKTDQEREEAEHHEWTEKAELFSQEGGSCLVRYFDFNGQDFKVHNYRDDSWQIYPTGLEARRAAVQLWRDEMEHIAASSEQYTPPLKEPEPKPANQDPVHSLLLLLREYKIWDQTPNLRGRNENYQNVIDAAKKFVEDLTRG